MPANFPGTCGDIWGLQNPQPTGDCDGAAVVTDGITNFSQLGIICKLCDTSSGHPQAQVERMPHGTNDPTPEEIRQRCLEIQATWTPSETKRRAGIDATKERLGVYAPRTWQMTITDGAIDAVVPTKF